MYMCLAYAAIMPTSITIKILYKDLSITRFPQCHLAQSAQLPFTVKAS